MKFFVPSLWYFKDLMFLVDQVTPDTCYSTVTDDVIMNSKNNVEDSVSGYIFVMFLIKFFIMYSNFLITTKKLKTL